jgi:CrcB protein
MKSYLWIAIGAGLGGTLRYWCGAIAAALLGDIVPWGTMLVNVLGSFIIGFFAGLTAPEGRFMVSPVVRQFVTVGFCGGYTTFSAFSLQTQEFMQRGEWLYVSANILSIVLALLAVWAGYISAAVLNPLPVIETDEREAADSAPPPRVPLTSVGSNDGERQ